MPDPRLLARVGKYGLQIGGNPKREDDEYHERVIEQFPEGVLPADEIPEATIEEAAQVGHGFQPSGVDFLLEHLDAEAGKRAEVAAMGRDERLASMIARKITEVAREDDEPEYGTVEWYAQQAAERAEIEAEIAMAEAEDDSEDIDMGREGYYPANDEGEW